MSYKTIHIFGFGENQLIDENKNIKVSTSKVKTESDLVVADIFAQKPVFNTATSEYHAVTIFKDMYAQYTSKNGITFRVQSSLLNNTLIDNLETAISNA